MLACPASTAANWRTPVRRTRPDLPVLITTGYAGQALTDMQLSSGMEILQKPFSLRALSVQVASLLEAHTQ